MIQKGILIGEISQGSFWENYPMRFEINFKRSLYDGFRRNSRGNLRGDLSNRVW
jgi:hypothetical protein